MNSRIVWLLGAGLLCMAGVVVAAETPARPDMNPAGANPNPVRLMRPPAAPLSAMAQLGKQVFYDASFSSSGKLACASCHSPDHAYGPPNDGPVMLGGPTMSRQGARAVPSLTYLER
jgi:cytochrome c peroxidase